MRYAKAFPYITTAIFHLPNGSTQSFELSPRRNIRSAKLAAKRLHEQAFNDSRFVFCTVTITNADSGEIIKA